MRGRAGEILAELGAAVEPAKNRAHNQEIVLKKMADLSVQDYRILIANFECSLNDLNGQIFNNLCI